MRIVIVNMTRLNYLFAVLLALSGLSCSDDEITETDQLQKDIAKIEQYILDKEIADAQSNPSGLHYIIDENGSGDLPVNGQTVTLHYVGRFLDDVIFDSSVARDEPFEFELGTSGVIRGFEESIMLLNNGAKGTFLLPSALAYGKNGTGNVIGPNEILIFEIEILDIK